VRAGEGAGRVGEGRKGKGEVERRDKGKGGKGRRMGIAHSVFSTLKFH